MSNSWWADKLGGGQPAQRPATPQPTYQPAQVAQSYPAQTPQPMMNPELEGHRLPASAAPSERCPNCASGNYGKSSPESRARCYDCGYPITQSGSGTPGVRIPGSASGGGPTQAAKQISTQNNYNPGQIIDRIG